MIGDSKTTPVAFRSTNGLQDKKRRQEHMKNRRGEKGVKEAMSFVPKYDLLAEFAMKPDDLKLGGLLREDEECARMKRKRLKS